MDQILVSPQGPLRQAKNIIGRHVLIYSRSYPKQRVLYVALRIRF